MKISDLFFAQALRYIEMSAAKIWILTWNTGNRLAIEHWENVQFTLW